MPKKAKRRRKQLRQEHAGIQADSKAVTASPTPSHSGSSTNPRGQDTLVPCNLAGPGSLPSSTPPTTSEYPLSSIPAPSVGPLSVPGGSHHQPSTAAGTDNSSTSQPSIRFPATSSSQVSSPRMFEGSTNFEIKDSIVTNAQGNVNIIKIDVGGPLSEDYTNVLRVSQTMFKMFSPLADSPALDSLIESLEAKQLTQGSLRKEDLEEYCFHLMKFVEGGMVKEGWNASQKFKDSLGQFYSTLSQISEEIRDSEKDDAVSMERICRKITRAMDSFMLTNCISGIVKIGDSFISVEQHALHQCIQSLPHVDAAYNDYESKKKSGPCFEGTREALLEEIAAWISAFEILQVYLLSGIAGVGKSTVAYTVAERAERIGYLGASFFFSRDEVERSNAKRFFTTIAFQLCLYDKRFAKAIERALLTERGLAAASKDPITQLDVLILEPLRDIVKSRPSPIVTVVDALDECDDHDAPIILAALNRLVHEIPCFKVILTTRPQPHIPPLPNVHKIFHLQDIEEKIIDGDIRLYLEHNLSRENVLTIFPKLRKPWGASSQDIDALVRAAGRLFIIASTSLRFVLNLRFGDPEHRMKDLRYEIDSKQLSFRDMDRFYTIILRTAINDNSDKYTKKRYQDVIGTIVLIQDPLPIEALELLAGPWSADAIDTLLGDLQSVIFVKDDTPRIYHKSFFDFVTNCEDDNLRIIPRKHHTRLAIRCFEIMNAWLRQNILDLGTPARFMNNDAGLAEESISAEQLMEKIPRVLRYACTYWANHIEGADSQDADLLQQADTFIKEHLLHWLEALSLIGALDIATDALRIIPKSMKSISSDLHGIISDALLFIPKFHNRICHSALHTYYSGLPFTPTGSPLLKSYSKDMVYCLCRPEGVPAQLDPLIGQIFTDIRSIHVSFSNDSSKFAMSYRGEMRLLKAENATVLRIFKGDRMSVAYDFSAVAISQASAVTLWSVASNIPIARVTSCEEVVELALSFDGSRLAAGLSNGTVGLWDASKGELITSLVDYAIDGGQLEFSPSGYRLAFVSDRDDGGMQLWNGRDGKLVARLDYMSKKHVKFVFSRDGCRLASLVKGYSLTLWGGEKGSLIGVAEGIGKVLAISEDGSFIATGGKDSVQFWSGSPLSLLDTIDSGDRIECLAISRGLLAIGCHETMSLYDINNRAFIITFQDVYPFSLVFSPDFTRLAVGTGLGIVSVYDVPSLKVLTPASRRQDGSRVSTLVFSSDSARLVSGFTDGTIQLWDTIRIDQPIATHKLHSREVNKIVFSLDGDLLVSGSDDRTVRLWGGRNGAPFRLLEHAFTDGVRSVAFSRSLLAASTKDNITLFDPQSHRVTDTLKKGSHSLSFSADGSFLASAYNNGSTSDVTVWNADGWAAIAEFRVGSQIDKLTFSPDGSQLVAQAGWGDGIFNFFDLVNKQVIEVIESEDLRWIPNFVDGILISWKWDRGYGSRLIGRFVGHPGWVPILWIPLEFGIVYFAITSTMVALGCNDGRILFIRF